ncbi:serine hydrolase [Mucilaginibacter sp. PAMB04274]|uniref:serine hydrolase n=1 Tax=Mucilaginibacter sp. PAMB04274 TaxID=3138568 RepID=UPI0031F64C32
MSIAVINNYKLEWAKGYGLANAAAKSPVTNQTLFQAGSISKSINAIGILKLVQTGSVDLNTDINKYLISWKFPYDSLSQGHSITLANLLSHTAELNVPGFVGYSENDAIPSILQVIRGVKPANSTAIHSIFAPGKRHEYSGGGTTISQLIVEDVTHQTYDRYMQNEVLKRLNMVNSTFAVPNKKGTHVVATGYYDNGKQIEGKFHLYPEKAAAGLWTTPTDLAKYIIAIQEAYKGKPGTYLNSHFAKLMLTPYLDQRAALGVFIDNFDGEKYFEHDGLTYGFYSQYFGSLTNGNGVVVMTNSVNTRLIPEIINSVAKVYGFKGLYRSKTEKNIALEDFTLQSYCGNYTLAPGAVLTIFTENKQLYVRLTGQEIIGLFPETASKFFMKVVDAQLEFIKDKSGNVTKVILYQNGSANEAPKTN